MDRLILGDNQFFGINHMSEDKAREQAIRFQSDDAIVDVLEAAWNAGVRSFMCTTHERMTDVIATLKAKRSDALGMSFMPCMPYAHKYSNAMAESGIVNAIRQFLPRGSLLDAAVKGGVSVAKGDLNGILRILVDAEMTAFEGVRTPVVFLQNVAVDFVVGMGLKGLLAAFAEHVREKYEAEPGFITMNLPQTLDALESEGITRPIVCANLNSAGFRVSGGVDLYQSALKQRRARFVAMSVFASGALPPREAIEWVTGQEGVEAIVFGASTARNIQSTVELVDEYWNLARSSA